MPRKNIDIQFPVLGVVRRGGLRTTAHRSGQFPTPWSMNVRLEDSLTNRLRGGTWVAPAPSATDPRSVLLLENGDSLLLEDGDRIALELADDAYVYLTTENGDLVTTENGDPIVLGPQNSAAADYGRIWVAGGDDAPYPGTQDAVYRDRLFRVDDQIIYASRQGDFTEWNYGAEIEDTGRATAFQLSVADEVGDDVKALVPHKDSHMLCFTANETWVLTGDPTTGNLRYVSREVGCIASRAWCKAHDTVYFLSSRGLYSVQADGSGLKAVSEDKLPEDLIGVSDDDAILDYHHYDRGVYIHLTEETCWFYDTARDGFWPFDRSTANNHIIVGPFRLGDPASYGRILNLQGNTAQSSADVTWRIIIGDTAEEAAAKGKTAITLALAGSDYSSYVVSSGTWSAGRSHMSYPRNRAVWCCVWLSSAGVWAYEMAQLTGMTSGQWR